MGNAAGFAFSEECILSESGLAGLWDFTGFRRRASLNGKRRNRHRCGWGNPGAFRRAQCPYADARGFTPRPDPTTLQAVRPAPHPPRQTKPVQQSRFALAPLTILRLILLMPIARSAMLFVQWPPPRRRWHNSARRLPLNSTRGRRRLLSSTSRTNRSKPRRSKPPYPRLEPIPSRLSCRGGSMPTSADAPCKYDAPIPDARQPACACSGRPPLSPPAPESARFGRPRLCRRHFSCPSPSRVSHPRRTLARDRDSPKAASVPPAERNDMPSARISAAHPRIRWLCPLS